METTATFSISSVGDTTGKSYSGTFKVRTVLSRRHHFLADERRRSILGSDPASALPALQNEAFVLGQLSVRVVEGPEWWAASQLGLDLEDSNVILEIFEASVAESTKAKEALKKQATEALERLKAK